MKLNRRTLQAVRLLVECARGSPKPQTATGLARRLSMAPQTAFKIVYLLSAAQLIVHSSGRSATVSLARDPASISVGDVVRGLADGEFDESALSGAEFDESGGTVIHSVLDEASLAFVSVLDKYSIIDLVKLI